MQLPSVQEMEAYIRQAAQARGIDPDIAVRVARSEGLRDNTWQSNVTLDYGREQSFGPFQLHVAPKGHRQGMGNEFIAATGLNPADPSTWKQGIDYALDQAATGGWGPWFGAKAVGITGMEGINNGKAIGVSPPYTAGPGRGSVAGYRKQPGAYVAGEYVPPQDITYYADNSPALPRGGAGAAMGGYIGGPAQVAARMPESVRTASVEASGDFRPTNFQQMAARQAMEGDQSQRARLLQAAGLDPTGKTRLAPRGENTGILAALKQAQNLPKPEMPKLPGLELNNPMGGILSKLFSLFG